MLIIVKPNTFTYNTTSNSNIIFIADNLIKGYIRL
jgi:hypothetical protein